MRVLAGIGYTLAGLALAAPAAAWAGPPIVMDNTTISATAPAQAKHRRAIFAAQHLCADCQRAAMMKKDGVNIPPPPVLPGQVVSSGACSRCGRPVLATTTPPARVQPGMGAPVIAGDAYAGYASTDAGYAVVGSDPMPIGASQPRVAGAMSPADRLAASRDHALEMASFTAPAPVEPAGANRPKVLSHLFGLSGIGRERAEMRARRKEESHASIPYGPQTNGVTDLPAKMVYGR